MRAFQSRSAAALLCLLAAASSSNAGPAGDIPPELEPLQEIPAVNIPADLHVLNWIGSNGSGSCVHASIVELLNWQGRPDLALKWRTAYSAGETPDGLALKLSEDGVRFASTTSGDVKFLEWSIRNRLGCGIAVNGGRHMVCLVHLDFSRAAVLDPNHPGEFHWMSRQALLQTWTGWAVTPVYSPPPRVPFVRVKL